MHAVAYCRVSTEEQGEGYGLAAQRAAIEAECDRHDWQLVAVREEIASGAKASNRPVLQEVFGSLRRGDAIVVAKLDRLARSVIDFAGLLAEARRRGFNIVALDFGLDLSTPQGELVANVLMSVAQWERRIIGQRTSEGMQVKISQGWKPHRPEQAIPAEVRRHIVGLHRAGLSQRGIAEHLNQEGIPPVGQCWHRGTIRRVLAQTEAVGLL
jgi:DNA invertase Pin-like site-specific DNA recombinase